ncbi:AT hook motif family protein [Penicillium digitatum]|uniref:AT hook motif family protein n=1 Tax=Penicillium digitatum TaxID=36651 RepID=A0A7T6XLG6_PENDI|nr:AT hook motif family protein [Penicillium digitatum]
MSDDDEYYEFEDEYMYEDLVPDMVTLTKSVLIQDDLAASSYYEAALYEDPGIDVEDYFSDWDYYSDDYHDDDATVEQSAERKKRTAIAATAPRRTKTSSRPKGHIAKIPPSKSPLVPDTASFQGVVWKTPAFDRDQDVAILYEPDTGDKVALLENWREVFKSAQPALDRSRLKTRHVESKPVDPSLADDEMFAGDGTDDEPDSEDEMSGVVSSDTSAVDAGDAGDASNTTPDPDPDSFRSMKLSSPPKVVIPLKRGWKRKAVAQKDDTDEDTASPRPKRVALRKGGDEKVAKRAAPPVRRSARQKK